MEKHSTSNIQQPTSIGRGVSAHRYLGCRMLVVGCWLFALLGYCPSLFGSTNEITFPDDSPPQILTGQNARELYNFGTQQLRAGKLGDAEMLLQASIAKQDGLVQPAALFNLGYVRFAQGNEALKKSPPAEAITRRNQTAAGAGAEAIQNAENALVGDDVQQMVHAYLAGHGARKEMRAALVAVQHAMEAHGKTLAKWQRALNDFKSAAELNPADTNAVRNAEIVADVIARLVDSMRQIQQSAKGLGQTQSQLGDLLKQLKGRIPGANMPPGAPGEGDDEEEGDGKGMSPEALAGLKESATGDGQEMDLNISPEQAGQMLGGIQSGGKLLPMGQGENGKPKDRSGRNW